MGIVDQNRCTTKGFTVVELLIVIIVIGILSTVAVFGYGNWRGTTNDSKRKSDTQQIATALSAYAVKNNSHIETGSGCGLGGNGNGWVNAGPTHTGAGAYPRSILDCLRDAGVVDAGELTDPSNCVWNSSTACGVYGGAATKAYMKATCTKSGRKITYILAYLETKPQAKATIDALCDAGTVSGYDATTQRWGTNFSMNHYVIVK